ncbi:MAG: UDP-3-O-(3-hydroxymyristoyl)glucosamine N-acyltransferase [Flavobacteriales bacterium]|nr:UDP-3-O-(3-hydroxymyristoyl)glucosamine N-acyltransferase [Flavobacteriales bacterium]
MEFSAGQIAELLQGRVDGDANATVSKLAKIQEGEPGALTFLANPQYTPFIYSTAATIAIVGEDFAADKELPTTLTLVRVKDARGAFAQLLKMYGEMTRPAPGIHPSAVVDPSAQIGADVYIGPQAFIGARSVIGDRSIIGAGTVVERDCVVGSDCEIHPRVSILHMTRIGHHCTLHSGVVLGSDGFGFAPTDQKNYEKVPQIGNVILEDYVEIGANTSVDRATLGSTIIKSGVKLDNLIQVAHNVVIGENTVIAAQTGIAGSTTIGKYCMIGGQVGIVGHIEIADEVKIAAQSGIGHSISEKGAIVQGSPAFGIGDYKKSYVGFRNLPKIMGQISDLEKRIKAWEQGN